MSGDEVDRDRPTPRRLVRPRRARLVGGVCSGLGEHFGVDPLLFRIAFVGLAIFSGAGVLIYLAFLLLVPEEGASRPPIRLRRSSLVSLIGAVAIVVAAGVVLKAAQRGMPSTVGDLVLGLGSIALVGVVAMVLWRRLLPREEKGRTSADRRLLRFLAFLTALTAVVILVAVAGAWLAGTNGLLAGWLVVAIGTALAFAAFTGRARWLALPAFVFAFSVVVTAAANVDLHGGVGDRTYHPTTLEEVRGGYRLGAGRLEIDLRDVPLPAGDTQLPLRLGMGEAVVVVPKGVCVATQAQIGGGYVGALDRQSGGLDVNWENRPSPPPRTPRLVLDAQVGLGALFVVDRPLDRGWGSNGSGSFQPGLYGMNEACYPEQSGSR